MHYESNIEEVNIFPYQIKFHLPLNLILNPIFSLDSFTVSTLSEGQGLGNKL